MTSGYEVSADDLREHATALLRICAQLDVALDAANAQSVPSDAFGYICSTVDVIGWFVNPLHEKGVKSVQNAIARADEVRAILADIGRRYDRTDTGHAKGFLGGEPQ